MIRPTLEEVGENEVVGVIFPGNRDYGPYKADKDGRHSFMLYWRATYHPGDPQGEHRLAVRGQTFLSFIRDHPTVRWIERKNWKWQKFDPSTLT